MTTPSTPSIIATKGGNEFGATAEVEIPADIQTLAYKLGSEGRNYFERMDAIAKALLAERQCRRWQPIETAPKDGTEIMCALYLWNDESKGYGYELVSWDGEEWCSEDNAIYPPTHWMPLPSPPSEA